MTTALGPESLLRAIFPEQPPDARICDVVTQPDDGTRLKLRDALNEALDTLPLTRGSKDSGPRARWKTVLELSYYHGLTREAIAQELHTNRKYVSRIRRAALIELRRNERVTQMLSAFFVPTGTGTTFDPPESYRDALPP